MWSPALTKRLTTGVSNCRQTFSIGLATTGTGSAYSSLALSIGSPRGGLLLEVGRVTGENAVERGIGGLIRGGKNRPNPRSGLLTSRGSLRRILRVTGRENQQAR